MTIVPMLLPHLSGPIVLRRLVPSDLVAFLAYRDDPAVARFQGWDAMDAAQARGFLADMAQAPAFPRGGWWQIGIADAASGALLGDMGLCLAADGTAVELGITLARAAQGGGRAEAAMRGAADLIWAATEAERIVVITDARNAPALRLIARLGLPQVDTLHETQWPEPVFHWLRPVAD
ncbi:GNAT family N-acetyltransferase [Jannaschia sp.]|nr:GNAT family N-acetyltransferase [Jannaschia sp.]